MVHGRTSSIGWEVVLRKIENLPLQVRGWYRLLPTGFSNLLEVGLYSAEEGIFFDYMEQANNFKRACLRSYFGNSCCLGSKSTQVYQIVALFIISYGWCEENWEPANIKLLSFNALSLQSKLTSTVLSGAMRGYSKCSECQRWNWQSIRSRSSKSGIKPWIFLEVSFESIEAE